MQKLRLNQVVLSVGLILLSGFFLTGCSLKDITSLKAKSGLQVVVDENKTSSLYLNDEYLDKTPYISKNIKPGIYKLKIVPTDKTLASYETQLTLGEGALTVVTWIPDKTPETSGGVIYELLPKQSGSSDKAEISFTTIPDSVILSFDAKPQTFSPLVLTDVEPGNHEFEAKLPSYQTQKHTLNAVAGKRLQVTIKLARQLNVSAVPSPEPTISQSGQPINPASVASSSAINSASLSAKINANLAKTTNQVLIKSTGFLQDGKEVLRVRAASDSAAATVGWAEVGKTYPHLGASTLSWYQLQLSPEKSGWVSATFAELIN